MSSERPATTKNTGSSSSPRPSRAREVGILDAIGGPHGQPGQQPAEDRLQAEAGGDEGVGQGQHDGGRDLMAGERPEAPSAPGQCGPDQQEHHRDQGRGQQGRHRPRPTAVAGGGDGQREQQPRGHVHDAGHRGGYGPGRGAGQPALADDRGQHRQRGDRGDHAHEQDEGEPAGIGLAGVGERAGQRQHQAHAQGQRDEQGPGRDQRDGAAPAAQRPAVDLVADAEHEDDHRDLTQDAQERDDRGREQPRLQVAGQPTCDCRAEDDAEQDLADHRRLAEAPEQRLEQGGQREDDGQIPDDAGSYGGGRHPGSPVIAVSMRLHSCRGQQASRRR
jgi:hypothetical protein